MRRPKKPRPYQPTLADLKPAEQITCFMCNQPKPAAGARQFRAHKVCEDCTGKVTSK